MNENSNLEKRLSDLERRHNKTREWLIDFISIVVAMSMVILLNVDRAPTIWTPEFVVMSVLELVVAYFVIRRVTRWAMELER
jgi:membrane protein YdbS with pleckstrin-like domain